ncbi:MAG: fibronectin type III domain-containing protein, partial [Acidobacteria bacterium]|nr:fibronectin type III domain-containing protein [Acidobacteriota bacterium]
PAIDVTWNANTDRDLAGYFVYRRRQDESRAVKLNQQPVPGPSYHDPQVQPGNTYFYSVSAIDERGNESKRSEEASEQVPR